MANFRKIIGVLIISALTFMMSGCFPDMGSFENEEEFYESFGTVYLYDGSFSSSSYSIEDDFYNEECINDFECYTDDEYYTYMIFKANRTMEFEEMFLHFQGTGTEDYLTVEFSVINEKPTKVRKYDDPITEEVDGETHYIDYDDPASIASTRVKINNKWNSCGFSEFNSGGKKVGSIKVIEDQYICLRFVNNLGSGKDQGLNKIEFRLTALLIRCTF